jgi:hypothetical protein
MPTLIAIVVSCIVFALFVGLMLMFCRCKRKQTKKSVQAKDYEMDSVRPSIVAQQNQAPPPYYPASGLENKALEHSMDLALAMEDQKTAIYATQNGYGYSSGLQVPSHNIPAECKLNELADKAINHLPKSPPAPKVLVKYFLFYTQKILFLHFNPQC